MRHEGFLGSALTGGFVLYQGDLFPERFRDAVIYPNLRANAMRVSRPGAATARRSRRASSEDLLTSTDRWFRPVKGLVGPDGALYVADWYDHNISHTDPKDRSKWYQPSRDTGRIWRVVPEGCEPRADGKWPLGKLSSDELVDLLKHPQRLVLAGGPPHPDGAARPGHPPAAGEDGAAREGRPARAWRPCGRCTSAAG